MAYPLLPSLPPRQHGPDQPGQLLAAPPGDLYYYDGTALAIVDLDELLQLPVIRREAHVPTGQLPGRPGGD